MRCAGAVASVAPILAAALYTNGGAVTRGMRMFARRLGKERGERTIVRSSGLYSAVAGQMLARAAANAPTLPAYEDT